MNFNPQISDHFNQINVPLGPMTSEQARVLNLLQEHRQGAIYGCAGSGKTLLAVEKALSLARQGVEVLLLCHNPHLADYIHRMVVNTRVMVSDFSTFVRELVGQSERPAPFFPAVRAMRHRPWSGYSDPTGGDLILAFDQLEKPGGLCDAVIIDGGQDFKEGWWRVALACLKDPDQGYFYIFFDDLQALDPAYGSPREFPVPVLESALFHNHRNAGEIFELFKQLQPDARPVYGGLEGEGIVREWLYASEDEFYGTEKPLFRLLREALISAESYSPDLGKIVVLSADVASGPKNPLDGFVFDTPTLQGSSRSSPLNWQGAVEKNLAPFGFLTAGISAGPTPTKADIKKVGNFCQTVFSRRKKDFKRLGVKELDALAVRWEIDRYGNLIVVWHTERGYRHLREEIILSFFSQPDWGQTLPPDHLRYRLTRPLEFDDHPGYVNVLLADIASISGLEADGVVFVGHGYMSGYEHQIGSRLYVALTRARRLLYILSPESVTA